jgi:hypothetical protein
VPLAGGGSARSQTANIGANFTSINSTTTAGLPGGISLEPPDTMGAVGISHYVQFNNGSFSIFNKSGGPAISQIGDGTFWTNAGLTGITSNNLSDPRIVYDPQSQRWFATELTINQTTNNNILIARSNTSDPTQGWKAVKLTANNNQLPSTP